MEGVLAVALRGPGERCPFSRRSACGLVEVRMRVGVCVTSIRAPRIQNRMSVRGSDCGGKWNIRGGFW